MTSVEIEKNTKDKILEAANFLFAQNGYGGTSIREIASKASVNLAAINYHFKNKEQLYLKVFDYNFEWIELGIQSLDEDGLSTVDFSIRVFRFFLNERIAVTNIFKILLSDHIKHFGAENFMDDVGGEMIGPPGHQLFFHKIKSEMKDDISDEAIKWAVKTIFTIISHNGLMMGTEFFKLKCKAIENLDPKFVEKELYFSVDAVLTYLKSSLELNFK